MKKTLLAATFLFLVTPILAQTPNNAAPSQTQAQSAATGQENLEQFRADAEEGIQHTLVAQIEAWNRGDLQGFMNGYWRSPELTFFSGANVFKGWQAALQRYQKTYQAAGKEMGKLGFQDLKIDLLGRQAAVVTGAWQLTMSDGKTPHGLFTLIMKRMQGGWKIVHDHTSAAEEK